MSSTRTRRPFKATSSNVWQAFAGSTLQEPNEVDLQRERKRGTERVIATAENRHGQLSLFKPGSGAPEAN